MNVRRHGRPRLLMLAAFAALIALPVGPARAYTNAVGCWSEYLTNTINDRIRPPTLQDCITQTQSDASGKATNMEENAEGAAQASLDLPFAAAQHSLDLAASASENVTAVAAGEGQFVCKDALDAYQGTSQHTVDIQGFGTTVFAEDWAVIALACESLTVDTYLLRVVGRFEYWAGATLGWQRASEDYECGFTAVKGVAYVACPVNRIYNRLGDSVYLNKVHRAVFVMTSPYSWSIPSYEIAPILRPTV